MPRQITAKIAASIAVFVFCTGFISQVASAQQYTATLLSGLGSPLTGPAGFQGQLIGGNPVLDNPGGSLVNLNPPAYFGSSAVGLWGNQQIGNFNEAEYTYYNSKTHRYVTVYTVHAILWNGSDKNFVDLHPAALTADNNTTGAAVQSWGVGVSNGQQVGYATDSSGYDHPVLWSGTASSVVDLLPTVWYDGVTTAIDNGFEVGYGTSGLVTHAGFWTGTAASFVDLQPATMNTGQSTLAYGVDEKHNTEVGTLDIPVQEVGYYGYTPNAVLWNGTADSMTDLNPTGYAYSEAFGAGGGLQVGYGAATNENEHACVWSGTAASFTDLHQFLPAGYVSSKATSIDAAGNIFGIAYAAGYFGGTSVPVEWSLAGQTFVSASESPAQNTLGWNNSNVTLTLTSPYSFTGSSITYWIDQLTPVTVSGSSAKVAVTGDGTHVVQYYATDGATGKTTQTSQNTIDIDTTVPVTSETFVAGVVTLTVADDPGDVPTIYYTLDGGSTTTYTAPITVSNVIHTLKYWSVDLAGNVEPTHTVKLGAVAPTLTSVSPFRSLTSTSPLTVALAGTGFSTSSVTYFDGAALATTYASPTSISAVIPAADLTMAAVHKIGVANVAPGVGETSIQHFTVATYAQAIGGFNSDTVGTTTFTMTPITSYTGFTPSGKSIHIVTDANTVFLNSYGVNVGNWIPGLADSNITSLTITGVYSKGTLTAWVPQE